MAGKKVRCPIMNQEYTLNSINFYSDSRNSNGFSAISKEGIFKIINDSKDEKEGFRKVCEKLNRVFLLDVYNYCKDKKGEASSKDLFIYYYAKNILLNQNYKDLDYSYSIFESICDDGLPKKDDIEKYLEEKKIKDAKRLIEKKKEDDKSFIEAVNTKIEVKENQNKQEELDFDIEDEDDFVLTKEIVKRWGKGNFTLEDYKFLEDFYFNFITKYEHDSPVQINIYINIAKTQLQANKELAEGNIGNYDKLMRVISTLMNDGNIKPVQETGANASDQTTLGTLIKKWENTKPIPRRLDDEMKKYIDTYMIGQLARIEGINGDILHKYEEELKPFTIDLDEVYDIKDELEEGNKENDGDIDG